MKQFAKLAAVFAATTMILSAGVAAFAEDQTATPLQGTPTPAWITAADLAKTANYKAVNAASKKAVAAIKKSGNVHVAINETLTAIAQKGKMTINADILANKTSGHVTSSTKSSGALGAQSVVTDCGYTKGNYYVAITNHMGWGGGITAAQALKSMNASSAKYFYDPTTYEFAMQPAPSCFMDAKPASVLKAITVGPNFSESSLLNSVALGQTNKVLPITRTKAHGTVKNDVYKLVGESANPENPESSIAYTANFYIDPKKGTLTKLTMTMDEPGMGFNVALSYAYVATSGVKVSLPTAHAVSGVALERAGNTLSANRWAYAQAVALANVTNGSVKTTHKKITPALLASLSKVQKYTSAKTATGVKISYQVKYTAPATAKTTTTVTGHACVNIVKSKAVAKACN